MLLHYIVRPIVDGVRFGLGACRGFCLLLLLWLAARCSDNASIALSGSLGWSGAYIAGTRADATSLSPRVITSLLRASPVPKSVRLHDHLPEQTCVPQTIQDKLLDKRQRQQRLISIDGHDVLRINNYSLEQVCLHLHLCPAQTPISQWCMPLRNPHDSLCQAVLQPMQ